MSKTPTRADQLRDARLAKNLTQAGLSRLSGVNLSTICKLEYGKTGGSFEVLQSVTSVLGIELKKLRAYVPLVKKS